MRNRCLTAPTLAALFSKEKPVFTETVCKKLGSVGVMGKAAKLTTLARLVNLRKYCRGPKCPDVWTDESKFELFGFEVLGMLFQ